MLDPSSIMQTDPTGWDQIFLQKADGPCHEAQTPGKLLISFKNSESMGSLSTLDFYRCMFIFSVRQCFDPAGGLLKDPGSHDPYGQGY